MAALLCWLDTRSRGDNMLLRLEDIDHTRLRPGQSEAMLAALQWLGIDWDQLVVQSDLAAQHEAAIDNLAQQGRLYACGCSRKLRREEGRRSPDGGFAYNNRCRDRGLTPENWRRCTESIRVRLPDTRVELRDDSGLDLSQNPAAEMGDPIVRRSNGVLAYHLVVVVDDAASFVTDVVRGRDLAGTTATQVQLQTLLDLPKPTYRHHFLLLETREDGESEKLAKMHGSVPFESLAGKFSGPEFCGKLAHIAGLREDATPCTPKELLPDFDWKYVREDDVLYRA